MGMKSTMIAVMFLVGCGTGGVEPRHSVREPYGDCYAEEAGLEFCKGGPWNMLRCVDYGEPDGFVWVPVSSPTAPDCNSVK